MSQGKIKLVLYFCFFLSGISGLVYEVLWAKYLALIFGNTAYAHTLVLAVFMGGLALGSYLLGRLADKISDKLGFYGWIEIGIAVFSIFTPVMFIFSKNIYLSAAKIFSTPAIIVTAKFIIGVLIMLPPTILMGGTLPILNKLIRESLLACENSVARLYYINSFGAVVGTLLAGFYLIYKFGMEFSVIIAVFINLFCGLTVLILSKFFVKEKELIAKKKEIINQDSVDIYYGENKKILNISLIAIFLSGFAAMLYEIVWIRLLSTILGSSTYAFSLMIASFILGITIGSYLISKLAIKSKFTFFFFGLCEILIGILVIVSLPFYEKLPFLFAKLLGIFSRKPETFVFYSIIQFFLSSLVMLPSTIFLGMTLPLVSRLFSGKVEFLGKRIGNVFALNTSGNILGAVISGLFLMPWLGVKSTLEIGVIINLFLGSLILFVDKNCSLKYKISFVSIVFFLFTVYKISIPDWNRIYFTAQLFRPRASEANLLKKGNILYYKDGLDGTVAVTKKNDTIALYVNGKADASSTADMPTQVLSAQIPLIIKPDSQNVLIVGLGSGVTCGSVLLHPVDSLDLVEISSSVVEANKYFSEVNYNVLKNQRLHLHIEDAKTFLQRTEKKYDVIISEPSNPWMSGVSAVFSIEFFKDCYSHLNKGGIMVQWIQSYEMDDDTFKMILNTFSSVFPEVTIWNLGMGDNLIIGSNDKIIIDFNESEERMGQEEIKKDLARVKVYDLFTLLNFQVTSAPNIKKAIIRGGTVNSDYFPLLEYKAPLALYTGSFVDDLTYLDERRLPFERGNLFIKEYLKYNKIEQDNFKNLFEYIKKHSVYNKNLIFSLVKRWHTDYPESKEASLAFASYNLEALDREIIMLENLMNNDKEFKYLYHYADLQIEKYDKLRSYLIPELFFDMEHKLDNLINLSGEDKTKFYYQIGKYFLDKKNYNDALHYLDRTEKLIESQSSAKSSIDYIGLLNNISFAYLESGEHGKAEAYAEKVLLLDKNDSFAQTILLNIGVQKGY